MTVFLHRQVTHRLRGTVRGAVVVGTLNRCAGAMGGKSLQDLFGDGGDTSRERPACMKSRICGMSQNRKSNPVVAKVVRACESKKDTPRSDQRGRKRKRRGPPSVDGCSTARHSEWPSVIRSSLTLYARSASLREWLPTGSYSLVPTTTK